jgi:hypothetical protein
MLTDEPSGFDGHQIAQRLVPARPVAFDGVAEGVKAGDHRDSARQRVRQFRIDDGASGI